jgi:hypothetical protein
MDRRICALLTAGALAAGQVHAATPAMNQQVLKIAVVKYLEQKGNFCLGKFNWPIAVSDADRRSPSNDALQMPVLEKLGLVAAGTGEDPGIKLYDLTAEGRKYYQLKTVHGQNEKPADRPGDFCAAKLALDRVIAWEPPQIVDGEPHTTLKYTYRVASAAPWTSDADVKRVFPMIRRIMDGAGSMQLSQTFALRDRRWVAITPAP